MPVDPAFLASGAEWQVVAPAAPGGAPAAAGFGDALAGQLEQLGSLQSEAAGQAQALAAGTATDPTQVVMSVERARLAMQLAAQLRDKALEAVQDVFHTQV